jgi:hypothetical protein
MVVKHRVHHKSDDVMVFSKTTGEVAEAQAAGFWTTEVKDATQFVKLFVGGVKALGELSSAGTKVFEILYREVQKHKDKTSVLLNFSYVDQDVTPISESLYYRGLNELVTKEFIAPSLATNLFWINPSFMWNGDRLVFARDYILEGTAAAAKHRARIAGREQRVLPFEDDDSYSPELEAQDPFFDRANQAKAVEGLRAIRAGDVVRDTRFA